MRAGKRIGRTGVRLAVLVALALGLDGCVSFGGGPKTDTLLSFTPTATAPAGSTITTKGSEAIIVLEPEADRRLDVQRVAVQVDSSNVAYLKKAMWVERPTRLFAGLLAETLRARSGRIVYESSDVTATGDVRLAGRLIDMGYDAQVKSVVVRYDAIREAPDGMVTSKRFESIVADVDPKAKEVGPALNRAANEVAVQVADWIASGAA
jgi:cholesterol transport system auxiliary component